MKHAFLIVASAVVGSCSLREVPHAGTGIVVWRLVEVDAVGGKQLALEQEPFDSVPAPPRIEVRLSSEDAAVGEEVEAEIWLPKAVGRHRIEVRPSRPEVRVLGPPEFRMEGSEAVRVRFTCDAPGRGGILVVVRE